MTQPRSFCATNTPDPSAKIRWLPFLKQTPLEFTYPAISVVQAHWEMLRAGRTAPARSEIDLRPLAAALDLMFIAEVVAPGVARLRLCGQHFSELLGMEPRGMPLSVFFTVEARADLAKALTQVSQGARAALPLRAEKGIGRPGLDGMLALMPLTDHTGAITRILGVLETHGQIGRAPRKFRLMPRTLAQPVVPQAHGTPTLHVIKGGRT